MDEVCGGCGAALPSSCRFCMHCGAPHHTKSVCACGHDVTNMKFCAGCGEPTRATPARSGPTHAAPSASKGLDMALIAESIRREQEEKGNLRLKAQELAAKKRAAAEARFAQAYGGVPHPTASPAVPAHHSVAALAPKAHAPTPATPRVAQPAPRASTYVPPPPPTTHSRPTPAAVSTYARPKSAPMSQPAPSSAHAYRPVPAQSSPSAFRPQVSPPRSSPLPSSSFPVQQVLPPATTAMTTLKTNGVNNASLFPMAASIASSMAPPILPASSSTASTNQRFGPQGFFPPRFVPPEEGQNHVYSVTQTVTRSVTYTQ